MLLAKIVLFLGVEQPRLLNIGGWPASCLKANV